MKIPAKLPQFLIQKTLLIVTSRQNADFYFAYAGNLEKVGTVEVPKPHYFDREGFFIGRNNNGTFRSGAVYELDDHMIKQEFLPVFKKTFSSLRGKIKFSQVYVFSPSHMITEIKKIIPSAYRNKIAMSFKGNYISSHPLELLRKIDRRLEKKISRIRGPRTGEEQKILEEAEKARQIDGGKANYF